MKNIITEKNAPVIKTICEFIAGLVIGTACGLIGNLAIQKISVFYGKVFNDIQKAYE